MEGLRGLGLSAWLRQSSPQAVIGVAFSLAFTLGPMLGASLPVETAPWLALLFAVSDLLFICRFLPETLPPEKRVRWEPDRHRGSLPGPAGRPVVGPGAGEAELPASGVQTLLGPQRFWGPCVPQTPYTSKARQVDWGPGLPGPCRGQGPSPPPPRLRGLGTPPASSQAPQSCFFQAPSITLGFRAAVDLLSPLALLCFSAVARGPDPPTGVSKEQASLVRVGLWLPRAAQRSPQLPSGPPFR